MQRKTEKEAASKTGLLGFPKETVLPGGGRAGV